MSSATVKTNIVISAFDRASTVLGGIGNNLGKLENRFQKLQRRVNAGLNNMAMTGAGMTAAVTMPVMRGVDAALDKIEDFETNTARLANAFDEPIEKMAAFQKQAMDLAPVTPFGAAQIVGAHLELKMAGFNQEEILKATPDVLNFATVAEISVPQAAQLGSDVLRGLGADVGEFSDILDMASKAATLSNQSALQFMQGLVRAAPIAKAAGIPIEDLIAQLATLADAGFKAGEGGNALRTILLRLAAPTAAAQRQFDRLGINIADFGGGKLGADSVLSTLRSTGATTIEEAERIRSKVEAALTAPLPEGVSRQQLLSSEIATALGADSKQQELIAASVSEAISSGVSGLDYAGLLQAIETQTEKRGLDPLPIVKDIAGVMRSAQFEALKSGSDGLGDLAAQILDSEGMSGRAAERIMETTKGMRQALGSVAEVAAVEMGEAGWNDAFKDLLEASITLLNTFRDLPEPTKNLIAKITLLAAAIGPALIGITLLGKGFMFAMTPITGLIGLTATLAMSMGALFTPIGLVVAALAGLAVWAGYDLFGFLKDFEPLQQVFDRMSTGFKLITDGWAEGDSDKVSLGIKVIRSQLDDLWKGIKAGTWEWLNERFGTFIGLAQDGYRALSNLVTGIETIGEAFDKIANGNFAEGFAGLWDGLKLSLPGAGLLAGLFLGPKALIGAIKGMAGGLWKGLGKVFGGKGLMAAFRGLNFASAAGFILKGLFKGLLRFIPVIGWALLAYDVVRLIWWAFEEQLTALWATVKGWMVDGWNSCVKIATDIKTGAENMAADVYKYFTDTLPAKITETWESIKESWKTAVADALGIDEQTIDDVVNKFTAIGNQIADAVKAPFVAVKDWFDEQLKAIGQLIKDVASYLPEPLRRAIGFDVAVEEGAGNSDGAGNNASNGDSGWSWPEWLNWENLSGSSGRIDGDGGVTLIPGLTLNPQHVPGPMKSSASMDKAEFEGLLQQAVVQIAAAVSEGKTKVEVDVRASKQLQAAVIATSTGPVKTHLSTGSNALGYAA